MAYEKNENEIGALWVKTSQNGNEFMSGTINGQDVVCFRAKPSDRGPAWRVLKSQPRDGQRVTPAPQVDRVAPPSDDDLPF